MLCTFRNHHVPSNVFGLQIYTGYDFTYSFCLDKIPNIDLKKKIFTMKIFDNLLIPFWHSHQWQYFLFMVKVYYFLSICLGLLQNYQLLSRYIWCFADILRELIIKYKVCVCSFSSFSFNTSITFIAYVDTTLVCTAVPLVFIKMKCIFHSNNHQEGKWMLDISAICFILSIWLL